MSTNHQSSATSIKTRLMNWSQRPIRWKTWIWRKRATSQSLSKESIIWTSRIRQSTRVICLTSASHLGWTYQPMLSALWWVFPNLAPKVGKLLLMVIRSIKSTLKSHLRSKSCSTCKRNVTIWTSSYSSSKMISNCVLILSKELRLITRPSITTTVQDKRTSMKKHFLFRTTR